jgi:N-methylhydantoinase A
VRGAGVRYYGQLHDIEVLLPETGTGEPFDEEALKSLIGGFHGRHETIYGRSDPKMPVTIETIKLHAIGKRRPLQISKQPPQGQDASPAIKRRRKAYFKQNGGFVEIPCYHGDRLQSGNVLLGPAIIEETKTTVVVPPRYELTVDGYGNYMMRRS